MSDFDTKTKDAVASIDTDQVERQALRIGISNADFGLSDDRIVGSVDDLISESGNDWESRQIILEEKTGKIIEEIERRNQILGSAYPFVINGQSLTHVPSELGVYEFCLVASYNPTKRLEGVAPASVIFEWISRDVLKAYFGSFSRGFRTGWPRVRRYEKRGARAKQTYEILHRESGDFKWSPKLDHFPSDPSPRNLKDIGLDVVIWIPHLDNRASQFVALAQCGCGKSDISATKARELSLGRLRDWLNPLTAADPVRCFMLAHHVPNDSQLFELSTEGGIVFDRARIASISYKSSESMKSPEGIDYLELATKFLKL